MLSDYERYRGKCKEMSQAAVDADPSLTLVRGWYWCPIWNREEMHWWTKRPDGSIYDPTARQFPSKGHGEYIEFSGTYTCAECGKEFPESELITMGNYPVCSGLCARRLVGV